MFLQDENSVTSNTPKLYDTADSTTGPEVHPSSISTQAIDASLSASKREAQRRRDYLTSQRAEIDRELEALSAICVMFESAEKEYLMRKQPVVKAPQ